MNDYLLIDQIIESYHENYSLKACIMVGEDTDTLLSAEHYNYEAPSTMPWYTVGGPSAYQSLLDAGGGTICGLIEMDICISLLYPCSDYSYQKRSNQIASAFNKFSNNRHIYLSLIHI